MHYLEKVKRKELEITNGKAELWIVNYIKSGKSRQIVFKILLFWVKRISENEKNEKLKKTCLPLKKKSRFIISVSCFFSSGILLVIN